MLAPESTTNSLSSGFIVDGAGKLHSLVGENEVCPFLWACKYFWQVSTRLRGRIALVFQSLLKICPQTAQGTWLMRNFDLHFYSATDLFFRGCLLDAMQPLWILLVELVPTLFCPSWKSLQMLAARRPLIHNSTVAHFSQSLLHFCHHLFRLFVPQPSSAETSTLRRIYNPIQTHRIGIREDANTHTATASTFQEVFARLSIELPRLAIASDVSLFVTQFCLLVLVAAQRLARLLVSVLHDRYSHARNCIGLPLNTAFFLTTGDKYLSLFQRNLIPSNSLTTPLISIFSILVVAKRDREWIGVIMNGIVSASDSKTMKASLSSS